MEILFASIDGDLDELSGGASTAQPWICAYEPESRASEWPVVNEMHSLARRDRKSATRSPRAIYGCQTILVSPDVSCLR
jgi:hypothetical protein